MGKKSHKELIAKIKQPLKELDTQYKMQGTICNDIEKQINSLQKEFDKQMPKELHKYFGELKKYIKQ